MSLFRAFGAFVFLFCWCVGPAAAATLSLNFDDVDYVSGPILEVDGATIENLDGSDFFVYETGLFGMPEPGGFCALDANGDCKANAKITFDTPVTDLRFSSLYVSNGDSVVLRVVVDDEVTSQFFVTSETIVDLSSETGITEVMLFDVSGRSDRGIAFGGFTYSEFTEIPVPAGLPLLATALMFLGFGRLKLNARKSA